MSRKRTLATVLILSVVAILVLSACGGGSADFSSGFKSKDPTTFVVLEFSGGPDTLDPALAYDSGSGEILQQTYDTLIVFKRESVKEMVPSLATEVPSLANGGISADGLTYIFKIRPGVKFHNGDTLTAEDVAFTFQRGILSGGSISPQWLLAEPLLGSTSNNDITDILDPDGSKGLIDNRDGLKAEDPAALKAACQKVMDAVVADNAAGTVTFKLAQNWGPFLATLTQFWGSIQEKKWVAANGGWDGDCGTWQNWYAPTSDEQNAKAIGKQENGTGPFKLKEWGDQEITMVANEDYWVKEPMWSGAPTGSPKIKTLVIKFIDEFATRFAAFKAGDADAILAGSAENWAQLDTLVGATCDTNGICKVDDATKPAVRYIKQAVATRTDIFLNFKINTEGGNALIGSGKLDGNGIPADFFSDIHVRKAFAYCFDWDTYITDIQQGEGVQASNVMLKGELGDEPNGAHYSYDPKKCEEEFKASTWKSEDGKSLWDTGFRMTIGYNSGNQTRQSIAQIFQNTISSVNPKFKVEAQGFEFANYLDVYQNKKLPMFILGWIEDIPDPHNWTSTYTVGPFGGKQGLPADLKAQFQDLVTKGVHESDPAKRAAIYKEFNKLFFDQVPTILGAQAGQRYYFQRWVNGYYTNPLYSLFYYYPMSKN